MMGSGEPKNEAGDRRNLAGVKLFSCLDADAREAIERECAWRRYRTGERVFERGSQSSEVFFVIEGAVNIVSFSSTGREITFAEVGFGETVGELAAIDGQPRSASVVATEDSLLAILPAESFIELLKRNGEVAFALLQRMSGIVRKGTDQVIQVSSVAATNRVYSELLSRAEQDPTVPDLWVIKPLPPIRELASTVGTTRELVSNTLNRLYPSGLIRRKGTNLYIMDRSALEELVKAGSQASPDPN
jgi:CRP/FNR family cyclic AMP-dependent transcriptional regulator